MGNVMGATPSLRPFRPGWSPQLGASARARVLVSRRFATIRADLPIPPAAYIPSFRELYQGQAGTCWEHAGVADAEDTAQALGLSVFPICRRLVGWQGKQFEGGGNQSDGGSPTDALMAMSETGAGAAHEALFPYTDNYGSLSQRPPDSVFQDAKPFRLSQPVAINSDDDARRLISNKHGCVIGIWWPYAWDKQGANLIDWIGQGEYGHALLKRGYVLAGVFPGSAGKFAWWNLRNWHGRIYAPLPPEFAACVPGYKPDTPTATTDFWVRADVLSTVMSYGYAERVSFTDMAGFGHLFTLADALAL